MNLLREIDEAIAELRNPPYTKRLGDRARELLVAEILRLRDEVSVIDGLKIEIAELRKRLAELERTP